MSLITHRCAKNIYTKRFVLAFVVLIWSFTSSIILQVVTLFFFHIADEDVFFDQVEQEVQKLTASWHVLFCSLAYR